MDRAIMHVDMNNCYASIECLHNPAIRGLPVAVGGDVEARHGIILAKNYLAKEKGVKTGEALWEAKLKCPNLVIVQPHYGLYLRYNRMLRNILEDYTELVEFFGIDEGWIDVSASLKCLGKNEVQIAEEIRQRVKDEMGVTVSIGVSWNKIFAKLGSDYKKPDAVTIFTRDNYKKLVWPLPAEDLLGVGRATKKKFERRSVQTIGDIANTPLVYLKSWLGKWGEYLHAFANGEDISPVARTGSESLIKSIGNSLTTPRDLMNENDVKITFYMLGESVATRLRKHGLLGNTVQISLRDNKLFSFERQLTLSKPTCLTTELCDAAMILLRQNYKFNNPLRSVGIRAMNLVSEFSNIQLDLLGDELKREKEEKIERAIDGIRRRFGHHAILRGILYEDEKIGKVNPEGDHTIHPVGYF